jgi:hypothetical protein
MKSRGKARIGRLVGNSGIEFDTGQPTELCDDVDETVEVTGLVESTVRAMHKLCVALILVAVMLIT